MRKAVFLVATILVMAFAPANTRAQDISFGVFYSSLAPYGEWANTGTYGMCWRPAGMPPGWAPYSQGHWIWTEYGWTWVSEYRWGWAPFHYGRWVVDPVLGWVWVPGYVWAPAWVQWRWGDGYCGWAPLPPGFHFRVDVVVGPDGRDFGVGLRGWNFIRAQELGGARYRFVGRSELPHVMVRTRNITRLRFTPQGVFQVGLPKNQVERVTRRRIGTVNVIRTNDISRERIIGNSFHIYSPAPYRPRVRDEQEVIRRERASQSPERIRREKAGPPRVREDRGREEVRREGESRRVERRKDAVKQRRDAPASSRENPKRNE